MKIELITMEEFKKRTSYWIFTTDYYCPVCSSTERFRNKMPMPMPEDWADRHEEIERYDYCSI